MTAKPRTACRGHRAAVPMGRRELLRAGALGLVGLSLPELLQARAERSRRGSAGAGGGIKSHSVGSENANTRKG